MVSPESQTETAERQPSTRRPFPLKIIFWVFVFWTLLGWLRFFQTLSEADLVLSLRGPSLFGYLLLAGLTWGLLGLPVLWALLRREGWAPQIIRAAGAVYPALYWFERLFLWRDPNAARNWPFMLLLTVGWLGLVYWGLHAANKSAYFSGKNEQGKA